MSNVVFHPGDIFVQSIPPVVHASRRPPPMTPEEIANEKTRFLLDISELNDEFVTRARNQKHAIFSMIRRF